MNKDALLARAHGALVEDLRCDIDCGWVMENDGPRPGTSDRATARRAAESLTLILDIEMAIGRQDMSGQPAWMPDLIHAGRLDVELFGKDAAEGEARDGAPVSFGRPVRSEPRSGDSVRTKQ